MAIILGRIKDGKVEVQRFFQSSMPKYEGKSVEIRIEEAGRSVQANRYMWGVVYKLISDHTGYTLEEVHQVFKKKFLTYKKDKYEFTRSTTELNVSEFKDYLDKVIMYATTELALIIPDPDIEYENNN